MISKTKITKRLGKKRNPLIVETIKLAKKQNQLELAKKLSSSNKNYKNINLSFFEKINDKTVLIPGKVLGNGEINHKKTIIALSFSESAKEKLKSAKCETKTIIEELKHNKELKGVKIL